MKVFISHGHNEAIKLKLRIFIKERLGLEPVILAEQPDEGLTIIEKLEKYGRECDFALIVLTADDETADGGARARQNVIHELGYFHGILGRERVLLLKEKGVEIFSNISGLIYKEFLPDAIQSVFEDIRLAIESGGFSRRAESVPRETGVSDADAELLQNMIIQLRDIVTSFDGRLTKLQQIAALRSPTAIKALQEIESDSFYAEGERAAARMLLADAEAGQRSSNIADKVEQARRHRRGLYVEDDVLKKEGPSATALDGVLSILWAYRSHEAIWEQSAKTVIGVVTKPAKNSGDTTGKQGNKVP